MTLLPPPPPSEILPRSPDRPSGARHEWLRALVRGARAAHPPPSDAPPPGVPPDAARILAPMVDASDLPFRLLCRRYGSDVCYTPMIHAKMFTTQPRYRAKFWRSAEFPLDGLRPGEDRPLVAQFCGNDPAVMLAAALIVQDGVDAVDINCGCPQNIARRGSYGAYLLERGGGDELVDVVRTMASGLDVPLCVKVRILPSGLEDSIALYTRLIDAGAALLTVHGRTRHQRGRDTGECDWDAIAEVVRRLGHRVPIIANGGIGNMDDARECLKHTGADGIMSSEAVLEYPPAFLPSPVDGRRAGPGRLRIAREYVDLVARFPPEEGGQGSGTKCVKAHLHRMLHPDLQEEPRLRDAVDACQAHTEFAAVLDAVEDHHARTEHDVDDEELSWYMRHRKIVEGGMTMAEFTLQRDTAKALELDETTGGCMISMFGDSEW